MGSWCAEKGYLNTAKYFYHHGDEERVHNKKVITFIEDKDVLAIIPQVEKPDSSTWVTIGDLIDAAMTHEKLITDGWNTTATLALKSADHDCYGFSLEFLKEQREEHVVFLNLFYKWKALDNCPGIAHAKAAIKMSGHAPNPSGIKAAVYRKYPQLKHQSGGTVSSLIQRINTKPTDFIQRLKDPNRKSIPNWKNQKQIATHKMSWATDDSGKAIIYPDVQNINGKLYDFTNPKYKHKKFDSYDSAVQRGDTIQTTPAIANKFTSTYKNYYPRFKKGGYLTHDGADDTSQDTNATVVGKWGVSVKKKLIKKK